ncbi:MAG TPA: FecR domain-containing protein, partial [Parapedobacter sp.]|nr:FecR domain-containing protein [Parapedobacter sp.]
LDEAPANRAWFDALSEQEALTAKLVGLKQYDASAAYGRVSRRMRTHVWLRIAVAASLVFAAGAFSWFTWLQPQRGATGQSTQLAAAGVMPGGNRATLTLADGRAIDLSDAQAGIVVGDGVTYLDGTAVLDDSASGAATLMSLTTPKGGTYQITLPDGSKVWLNANSTLKYPSQFSKEMRVVELEGEAYFDVSHQTNPIGQQRSLIPFLVKTNGQTIEVLGTQFNVSAYLDDSEAQTTLVEGSVRLSLSRKSRESSFTPDNQVVLKPGEQGQFSNGTITTRQVDTEQFTAWRYGRFVFQQTPMEDVLRQLGRWYDIEVNYAGLPERQFNGDLPRNVPLSEALRLIELTSGVRLGLTERRLQVIE